MLLLLVELVGWLKTASVLFARRRRRRHRRAPMVKATPITPPTTPPAMGPAFEASCDPCVMFVFDDSVLELFEEDGDLS